MRQAVFVLSVTTLLCAVLSHNPCSPARTFFRPRSSRRAGRESWQRIGDGVAILQGTTERPGEQALRQNNQFFYLTGVVEPRAIVTIDGRRSARRCTCSRATSAGRSGCSVPACSRRPEAAAATGVDAVAGARRFRRCGGRLRPRAAARSTRRSGRRSSAKHPPRDPVALWRATKADPWDGRDLARGSSSSQKLKAAAPQSDDQGSRSDPRRAARDQEPARDRGHPRGDADCRPRHHRGDARRAAGHERIRAAGRRRVRLQEARRLRAVVLRADRDRPQHVLLALPQEHRDARRTATSSSSTTRPTTSTTSRT